MANCIKVYVPQPDGRFGMVFKVTDVDGRLRLDFLAFGVRHHPKGSHAPDVYDFADERVSDITARDLRSEDTDAPAPPAQDTG